MQRRHFLQSLGALGALSAMPGVLAKSATAFSNTDIDWSLGFQSVRQTQFDPLAMSLEGKLPEDLRGVLFRNGPALSERGGMQTEHWFDGDGMVQQFVLNQDGIIHQGKMVQTERFLREEAAQRFLYQHAGTHLDNTLPVRNNDTTNQANIAVQPWNDELLALWEGGSAYRLDPDTLETLGRMDWREDMIHMPFSAHPLPEKDGLLWNFGFAPYAGKNGMLFVYLLSQENGIQKVQPVTLPMAGYIHDFAQTEQHLIFLLPPYQYEHGQGQTYVDKFAWRPEQASRLLILEKADLAKQHWFELPAGFVFHFGNAWQHKHEIGVNLCWYQDASLMQSNKTQRINNQHRSLDKQAKVSTIIANLNSKKIKQFTSDVVMEFPSFDEQGYSHGTSLTGVGVRQKTGVRNDALTTYNPDTGYEEHFDYPEYVVAEEPLLISGKNQKDKYVIQTFLDMRKQQTGLNLFLHNAISAGPIVTATMKRHLPLGFHGSFISG
ncbi:carotenoid oxygenase family protein [Planctobacterium marinum]|uniref:Dioxygenase n=1 Tax=Planctobacterium marinum TaxID=1631968 RepID=A0AA48KNW0_9ALTE|nr:hypothetical protein MACH26_03090 [Planctobacterium marinum]